MQVSYELTLAEFESALKLHARQKLSRRIYVFTFRFVIPWATYLFLGFTLYSYVTGGWGAIEGLVFPDFVLVAILILALSFPRSRIHSVFRSLYPPGAKSRINSMEINDACILTSVEGVGEGKYLWNAVSAFVENEQLALLYVGEERFFTVPLRALTDVQRNELRELVARNLVKR
jgi:hypothetical protein